jgi:hypothetical protein
MYSQFKLVSIGHVVKDKPRDSDIGEFYPEEIIPETNSELDKENKTKVKNTNIHSGNESISVTTKPSIKAKWLALEAGNRITPPDLRKGETVFIYRYANTDMFYWADVMKELDLRRKEIVTYAYGNTDTFKEKLTKDNSYWFTVDTVNKFIQLHTSDNDGEVCKYDLTINTKEGFLEVKDSKDNYIKLDRKENTLTIEIEKDINIIAKETINVECKNMNVKVEETIVAECKNLDVKVEEVTNLECDTLNIKAKTKIYGEAPDIEYKGEIKLDGNVHITKDLQVDKTSTANADHISAGKSGANHTHGVIAHKTTTPPK